VKTKPPLKKIMAASAFVICVTMLLLLASCGPQVPACPPTEGEPGYLTVPPEALTAPAPAPSAAP